MIKFLGTLNGKIEVYFFFVSPDLVVAAGGDHILEALETELHEGDVAKGLHLLSTVVIGAGLGYNEVS